MNTKATLTNTLPLFDLDLKRTEHPDSQDKVFYWDGDILVQTGHSRFIMDKALSQFSPQLKSSFKHNMILFLSHGDYAIDTRTRFISALKASLNAHPTSSFDSCWIAKALTIPSFHRGKKAITRFFLHWMERDRDAINQNALILLDDTAAFPGGPRNVLSDDPNKSWLTDEEYDCLLQITWDYYDINISGTQVTLIKLLSMQYARRPIQIAHLKIGDIVENDDSNNVLPIGKAIYFPGAKDQGAETSFRDSKFEPHSLAIHLWDLCQIQRKEARALYEDILCVSLTEDQLNLLPLFCSEFRVKQALKIIEDQQQKKPLENLGSELFHLKKIWIGRILSWSANVPNCNFGTKNIKCFFTPRPPISPRTGQPMVICATRMRHTRARQLARLGVPNHILSHWLGHTSENSLRAYYNDPAEQARQLDESMAPSLAPLAMAFTGTLIDSPDQATRASDQTSKLEFAYAGELKNVGNCGKFSFCATTSVPIPCYRCKYFEPLVNAPHQEVLDALEQRQAAEKSILKIGGSRNLLIPIDLSADIRAVKNCIEHCNARNAERGMKP
ncbi:site-specific integrase [Pseudomonas sp. B21-017]|uniref:site-specific integrase n=1 Tax=Pseudomonas sp. B21-017 TaxID=2895474 RepID=UPI00215EAD46|nr:site-specific integrase [Pseudomonas sp. B21-017]UVM36314.1 site-specific integrase [Pseudomonas sp. B21-017]